MRSLKVSCPAKTKCDSLRLCRTNAEAEKRRSTKCGSIIDIEGYQEEGSVKSIVPKLEDLIECGSNEGNMLQASHRSRRK